MQRKEIIFLIFRFNREKTLVFLSLIYCFFNYFFFTFWKVFFFFYHFAKAQSWRFYFNFFLASVSLKPFHQSPPDAMMDYFRFKSKLTRHKDGIHHVTLTERGAGQSLFWIWLYFIRSRIIFPPPPPAPNPHNEYRYTAILQLPFAGG